MSNSANNGQVVSVQLEPSPYSNLPQFNTNNNGWQTQNSTGYPITSQPYYNTLTDGNDIPNNHDGIHQIDGQKNGCCTCQMPLLYYCDTCCELCECCFEIFDCCLLICECLGENK